MEKTNIDKLLGTNLLLLGAFADITVTAAALAGNKVILQRARKQRELIVGEIVKQSLAKKLK